MFTFYFVLWCNKKVEKLPKLKISERSVVGVRMVKPGPLKRALLTNQAQGFRIPNRSQASDKLKEKIRIDASQSELRA